MFRKAIQSVAAALVLVSMAHAAQPAASWPNFRGEARDNRSTEKGLLKQWPAEGPARLWKATGIGTGFATVAVADDMVYTAGDVAGKFRVTALAIDGSPKWTADIDNAWAKNYPGSRSTPTVSGGKVFIVSGFGTLACLDAKTGKPLWSRKFTEFGGKSPNWGFAESPLVVGDKVYITPGGATAMVALEAATGKNVWTSKGLTASAHYSSPILATIGGKEMLINGSGSGLVAFDPADGKSLWGNAFASGNTANCPSPAVEGDRVFWSVGYGKGAVSFQVDPKTGPVPASEWQTQEFVSHHGGYVIVDGFVYGNHSAGWTCFELKTGKKRWFDKGVGKGS